MQEKIACHDIRLYGFRIAESQHDGTHHWHLLIFMLEHQKQEVTNIIRHLGLLDFCL